MIFCGVVVERDTEHAHAHTEHARPSGTGAPSLCALCVCGRAPSPGCGCAQRPPPRLASPSRRETRERQRRRQRHRPATDRQPQSSTPENCKRAVRSGRRCRCRGVVRFFAGPPLRFPCASVCVHARTHPQPQHPDTRPISGPAPHTPGTARAHCTGALHGCTAHTALHTPCTARAHSAPE